MPGLQALSPSAAPAPATASPAVRGSASGARKGAGDDRVADHAKSAGRGSSSNPLERLTGAKRTSQQSGQDRLQKRRRVLSARALDVAVEGKKEYATMRLMSWKRRRRSRRSPASRRVEGRSRNIGHRGARRRGPAASGASGPPSLLGGGAAPASASGRCALAERVQRRSVGVDAVDAGVQPETAATAALLGARRGPVQQRAASSNGAAGTVSAAACSAKGGDEGADHARSAPQSLVDHMASTRTMDRTWRICFAMVC